MQVRRSGFTYSVCRSFTKNKERIQKFKEAGDSRYIYQNELDKAYFQRDMAYGSLKNLTRRTTSDKILRDKSFNIAKNPKYDRYERSLASMVYNKNLPDQQLAEELHKPIVKKFNKKKVHSTFIGNIYDADLSDIQLISKFSKGFKFLLCTLDIFSNYKWVIPLKEKKELQLLTLFKKCYRNVSNP